MGKTNPSKDDAPAQFGYLEYDVSCGSFLWLISFPAHCGGAPYKTILNLEPEELLMTAKTICGQQNRRLPYGELGSVGIARCCVQTRSGPISPGCGCETDLVTEIVEELKKELKVVEILGRFVGPSRC